MTVRRYGAWRYGGMAVRDSVTWLGACFEGEPAPGDC